ncbi:hypothetical protein [Flexivirga oryzae]|uniref:Uncharacterized protein n=1 Tax=Flexivirga oryzae TaxID=1794944 RepID=A0A839N7F1_9MICO|nr:hypothetical protein [Flexivirga oryzae]MBB2893197.1 hypothetical protein [Flexivirga oryzae]
MRINTVTRKLAAAVAGSVVLVGLAAGPALAATGGQDDSGVQPVGPPAPNDLSFDYRLYNDTPYTWTIQPSGTQSQHLYSNSGWTKVDWRGTGPAETMKPGDVMHLRKESKSPYAADGDDDWVSYTFTDADGGQHLVRIHADVNDNVTSFSMDKADTDTGWANSTAVFHMAVQPGAEKNSVGAFLNEPAEITVDASTSPDGAADAMTHFTDADATHKAFTPTADPTWTESNPAPGSATLINTTSSPAELTAMTGSTNTESTSLSESLEWDTELGVLGLANAGISASVESGQEWSVSNSVDNGDTMTVPACQQGHFVKTTEVENVTGDFDFTVYNGELTYHIKNVTVSMPGISKPGQSIPMPGTAFRPVLSAVGTGQAPVDPAACE